MEIPDTEKARKALKVGEIRGLLEEAGLDTTGTKPALLARLEEVRMLFESRSRRHDRRRHRSTTSVDRPSPAEADRVPRRTALTPNASRPAPSHKQLVASRAADAPGAADAPADLEVPAPPLEVPAPPAATQEVPPPPAAAEGTTEVPPPPALSEQTAEGATTEVPPPPPATEAPPLADEEEEDGGEIHVLVAPLPSDVNDEDAMRAHCDNGDNGEEPYGFGIVSSTEIVSVRFLEKRGGAAVLSFKSEKRATVAAKALDNAADDGAAEILRSTLWPDELSLFDPGNTKLRVAGVPPAIDENAMLSVFSTYGVVRRVAMDSEPNESELRRVCSVTMADRAGAETAAAALSGVYRFEETQEKPVAVTWCGLTPEYAGGREEESETEPFAAGKKRKRDGDETDSADVDEKTKSSPTQKN